MKLSLSQDMLILIIGLVFYSIFLLLGTFSYKIMMSKGYLFNSIFIVSMIFGILSFVVKIPLFYYYAREYDSLYINTLTLIVAAVVTNLFSYFILGERLYAHTYLIMLAIAILFVFNNYLTEIKNSSKPK